MQKPKYKKGDIVHFKYDWGYASGEVIQVDMNTFFEDGIHYDIRDLKAPWLYKHMPEDCILKCEERQMRNE